MPTRFVTISDTHTLHDVIDMPEGDVLIHSGDFTNLGSPSDIGKFNAWLKGLDYREKIVIAGNHDRLFEHALGVARGILQDCTYLQDEAYTIGGVPGGIKVYGSPWTPTFGYGWAFNARRGGTIRRHWKKIPTDTDVLITHGPPAHIRDWVFDMVAPEPGEGDFRKIKRHAGCEDLGKIIMEDIKPAAHIFGHLHEPHGTDVVNDILFINASICDEQYDASHRKPIVFDYEDGKVDLVA